VENKNTQSQNNNFEEIVEEVEDLVAREVEEVVAQEVPQEVSRQIKDQLEGLDDKVKKGFYKFQTKIKYNKVIYAILVISGVMLFWFGAWRIMSQVKIFENGLAALLLGALFLFITGTLYHKLVG